MPGYRRVLDKKDDMIVRTLTKEHLNYLNNQAMDFYVHEESKLKKKESKRVLLQRTNSILSAMSARFTKQEKYSSVKKEDEVALRCHECQFLDIKNCTHLDILKDRSSQGRSSHEEIVPMDAEQTSQSLSSSVQQTISRPRSRVDGEEDSNKINILTPPE